MKMIDGGSDENQTNKNPVCLDFSLSVVGTVTYRALRFMRHFSKYHWIRAKLSGNVILMIQGIELTK